LRSKAPILYLILSLALLALIAVSAYSLSRYLRFRENRRIAEQGLMLEIQSIVAHCQDQILRHPDYDLRSERLFLTSFSQSSSEDQLRNLGELKGYSQELALSLLWKTAGIRPGDPEWKDAVRFKTYSPNGFKQMYDQLDYCKAEPILEVPPITGDRAADERMAELSMRRGYRLRQQAEENALVSEGFHSLQEPAMNAWRQLQAAARREGIRLELVSAYRSADRQRQIFLRELRGVSIRETGETYTIEEIASGRADRWVEEVLQYSAIPGFSKHHSGYTIDISDPSGGRAFTDFEQTDGFGWISAHNYLNAKRFGFIPSYPAGAAEQGPEPEPWEYVWVGRERLLVRPPVMEERGGT
jgi:D-alanyl-D-alanine carboxypeptidase